MTDQSINRESNGEPRQRNWFRFSLKSLLIMIALVAVYLGGRASTRPHWFAPQTGTWKLTLKSGFTRMVTLDSFPGDALVLNMGSNSTMGGKYRWKGGQLVVDVPNDKRYVGLAWQWDGDDLVLVAEPPSHPAGPSYVGARLRFVSPDLAAAKTANAATVNIESIRPPNR